jgi:hypothetical protein
MKVVGFISFAQGILNFEPEPSQELSQIDLLARQQM